MLEANPLNVPMLPIHDSFIVRLCDVQTHKKGGLKTTDDIAKAIRGGTSYIWCLMTAERYNRLKGKKPMFEGVNLD